MNTKYKDTILSLKRHAFSIILGTNIVLMDTHKKQGHLFKCEILNLLYDKAN